MTTDDNIQEITAAPDGAGLRIGIVVGRFNQALAEGLLASCVAALNERDVQSDDIYIVDVPGALEIPLALQKLADTDAFDALIALGAVVRGETYHFEVVSDQSAAGIMQVALDTGLPIANGILTTEDDAQAEERMAQKGADCAAVAVEMANLLEQIEQLKRQ